MDLIMIPYLFSQNIFLNTLQNTLLRTKRLHASYIYNFHTKYLLSQYHN